MFDTEGSLINKTKNLEIVERHSQVSIQQQITTERYVPGTFLGTEDVIMSKADKNLCLHGDDR